MLDTLYLIIAIMFLVLFVWLLTSVVKDFERRAHMTHICVGSKVRHISGKEGIVESAYRPAGSKCAAIRLRSGFYAPVCEFKLV